MVKRPSSTLMYVEYTDVYTIQSGRTKWSPVKDTMHEINQHLALAEKIQELIGLSITPTSPSGEDPGANKSEHQTHVS